METRLQSKEIRLPKFDLTSPLPCQYFKSSFAKTLSTITQNSHAAKSLDYFGLQPHHGELTASNVPFASMDDVDKFTTELETSFQQLQQQQANEKNYKNQVQQQNAQIRNGTQIETHRENIWNIKQVKFEYYLYCRFYSLYLNFIHSTADLDLEKEKVNHDLCSILLFLF
jgi:hypothetical protein